MATPRLVRRMGALSQGSKAARGRDIGCPRRHAPMLSKCEHSNPRLDSAETSQPHRGACVPDRDVTLQ
jgi:hypothetical protein